MRAAEVRARLQRAEDEFRREADELRSVAESGAAAEPPEFRPNAADSASDTSSNEIARGLHADVQEVLAEIDAARGRLASGTYGRCARCGAPIADERLHAVPWARLCARDQAGEERSFGRLWSAFAPGEGLDGEEPGGDDTATTWDPEDDHSVASPEESAVHEVPPADWHSPVPAPPQLLTRRSRSEGPPPQGRSR